MDGAPTPADVRSRLTQLAYGLHWSWREDLRQLFARIDPVTWRAVHGNPVALLARVEADRLAQAASDAGFAAELERIGGAVADEEAAPTWFARTRGDDEDLLVAYFCSEYGLTEALPIYSGGLGVLAGEHLKSAHALGVPLVAVGLAYRGGYFRQSVDADGWQHAAALSNDFDDLPTRAAQREDGTPATVTVRIEGRPVEACVREVTVGRIRLLLLDTDVPSNEAEDRAITSQLYGGDSDLRIRQELILGVGGLRALDALGLRPTVFHMNEGHSAFMALERIRRAMVEHGLDFQAARELCAASNVFTTHTPVPAGFDVFTAEQLDRYTPDLAEHLGTTRAALLALGAHEGDPEGARGFNMAYLALRCSRWINGVSRLHARVSRGMWRRLWSGFTTDEVPIVGVTNGVHTRSWAGPEAAALLDEHVGPDWATATPDAAWDRVADIDGAALWAMRATQRKRLVEWVREREGRGDLLDPEALTIGFARRFATYKRASLLLREPDRLRALLLDARRPLQFLFSGKAHPRDRPGQEVLRQIVRFARDPAVRHRFVFLERYDIEVARYLVQGVDVWLNNPRRPKEASGTSGMKVCANGGLNLSVLDGWWAEAYDSGNGWAIGDGRAWDDPDEADRAECEALFGLLEDEVIPEFYGREASGVPPAWLRRVRSSMATASPAFSTDRMVRDYTDQLYRPALRAHHEAAADQCAEARATAASVASLQAAWPAVRVVASEREGDRIEATVALAPLGPGDVHVEVGDEARGFTELEPTTAARGTYGFAGRADGGTLRIRPRVPTPAPPRGLVVLHAL